VHNFDGLKACHSLQRLYIACLAERLQSIVILTSLVSRQQKSSRNSLCRHLGSRGSVFKRSVNAGQKLHLSATLLNSPLAYTFG
jgi:hypothetical protein